MSMFISLKLKRDLLAQAKNSLKQQIRQKYVLAKDQERWTEK